jgi:hypothetical protein
MLLRLITRVGLVLATLSAAGPTLTEPASPVRSALAAGPDTSSLPLDRGAASRPVADARDADDELRYRIDAGRKRAGKSFPDFPTERWRRTRLSIQVRRIDLTRQAPSAVNHHVLRTRAPPAA